MFRETTRVGDLIFVIGTVGRDADGNVVDGVQAQTQVALDRIEAMLAKHDVDRRGIVRIRAFVIDMREWPIARDVIAQFFNDDIPPAIAMSVTGLVEPSVRIELEVDAAAGDVR
jgi:enamine deaminase RidA (YjgF/YER057c/UK114 family)